jgi:hypothetical protein
LCLLPGSAFSPETAAGADPPGDNAAVSRAATESDRPSSGPPSAAPPAAVDNVAGIDNTWVDRSHGFVERCLFAAADWCDRLLGGEALLDPAQAQASVWWKNDFRYDGLQHYTYRTAFRASIRLPRATRKLRLVIAGENQGDPTAAIPVDPGTPGTNVRSPVRVSSLGLVYDLFRTPQTFFNVGGGVQMGTPVDFYARARFQYAQPLGADTLGRFTVTGAYHAQEGPGVSSQLDFERRLSPGTTLLWSNSVSLAEGSNGWAWGTDLSLFHALSGSSSAKIGGSARGDSRPSFEVQNYRVYTGYRRNILRSWLFWELEPDVNWPLREDGTRDLVWGATTRLEVLFLGSASPKATVPPPPPPSVLSTPPPVP